MQGVHSLLFPGRCSGCGRTPVSSQENRLGSCPLCPLCLESLPWSKPPWCRRCGESLAGLGAGGDLCVNCRHAHLFFDQAISPCLYEGVAKTLLVALKYRGRLSLAPFLGNLLARSVRERLGPDPADGIVPVPLHPTRLRARGFNQATALARLLSEELDLPCFKELLIRRKPTPPQVQLPREERLVNVAGAFALEPNPFIRLSHLILVDDIFTTGATANACSELLKEAGAARVTVVTVARG